MNDHRQMPRVFRTQESFEAERTRADMVPFLKGCGFTEILAEQKTNGTTVEHTVRAMTKAGGP
jgi:hypothetical protein